MMDTRTYLNYWAELYKLGRTVQDRHADQHHAVLAPLRSR